MRAIAPRTLALLLVVSSSAVRPAHATEPFARVGYGFTGLENPRGVRNLGMGATGTSDASGMATGYFNPASIAFAKATTLFGSYESMPFDQGYSNIEIAAPIPLHSDSTTGAWQFAGSLGFSYLNFPVLEERTIFLPEGTGHTYDPDAWGLSAAGATSWTHGVMRLAGGAAASYQKQETPRGGFDLMALDFGVISAFPISLDNGMVFRPRLGYAMLNLDTGADFDRTDIRIANESRGGFGFDVAAPTVIVAEKTVPSIAFSLDYDRIDRENSSLRFSAGAELKIVDMVHLRYGALDNQYDTYGVGVGWDFGHALFRLDYAHASLRDDSIEQILEENFDRDVFGIIMGMRW